MPMLLVMSAVSEVFGVSTGAALAVLGWARARQQLARLTHENARLAAENQRDPLTGLANRRGVERALDDALGRRSDTTGLLYIDLDDFKGVNDRHGHAWGDRALMTLADRLRACTPTDACAGRMGGDELVVVLPAIGSVADAAVVAARIRADLARPIEHDGDESLRVTVSIGVAVVEPHETHDAHRLLEDANRAMRRAKSSGRDRVMVS